MKVLTEESLKELCRLVKDETDSKVDASKLSGGTKGQFLLSDGNGGISFVTLENAEGSKF